MTGDDYRMLFNERISVTIMCYIVLHVHVHLQAKHPLQTEIKINFERLGIRLLRSRRKHLKPSQDNKPSHASRLIANLTFYGLAVEGRISTDIAINGKLEGIQVTDITPSGRNYPDIVSMGLQSDGVLKPETSVAESVHGLAFSTDQRPKCLSFSIHRSPRSFPSVTANQSYDVHLSAFVPSIHYTHSVNFVYEIEMFVSEFQLYLTNSFKSAAVGVAKGFVREKSQLAEGLGKLSTSFGSTSFSRTSMHQSSFLSERIEADETDTGLPFHSGDRLYFDISVQTPVIVLPSSIHSEECLVSHLGEISVKNEFVQRSEMSPTEGTLPLTSFVVSPEIDRMVLRISNMSLHAARDKASREWLVSKHKDVSIPPSDKWFKVLKETTLMVQIDRCLGDQRCNISSESTKLAEDLEATDNHDVVISGKICEPLLIRLSKEVFDQVKSTLKHGLRRKTRPRTFTEQRMKMEGVQKSGSFNRTVRFSSIVQTHSGEALESLPNIFASFSLPKLSLELKHTIDGRERNLVYISLDDFSIQCSVSEPHAASIDLTLKSIVIEDLLQPENSEYRYLLASSSKPLPFLSPVPSPSVSLRRLAKPKGLGSSITRHLLPMTHLMSTPRTHPTSKSPLRSFSPYQDEEVSLDREESGSTLCEGTSSLSEIGDLLTINAQFVDEKNAEFATKYNSVSSLSVISLGNTLRKHFWYSSAKGIKLVYFFVAAELRNSLLIDRVYF